MEWCSESVWNNIVEGRNSTSSSGFPSIIHWPYPKRSSSCNASMPTSSLLEPPAHKSSNSQRKFSIRPYWKISYSLQTRSCDDERQYLRDLRSTVLQIMLPSPSEEVLLPRFIQNSRQQKKELSKTESFEACKDSLQQWSCMDC